MSSPTDPLWTPTDLAQYLGRSEKTLANDRHLGRGPTFLKLAGGAVRYRRTDVEAWLRTQEQQPANSLVDVSHRPRRSA